MKNNEPQPKLYFVNEIPKIKGAGQPINRYKSMRNLVLKYLNKKMI